MKAGQLLDRNNYKLSRNQSDSLPPLEGSRPSRKSPLSNDASSLPFSSSPPSPCPPPTLNNYQDFPFECQRRTPLHSPNDDLIDQLAVIEQHRYLIGAERGAYSYRRAIAALRAYPFRLREVQEVAALSGIGPKTMALVEEYLSKGYIDEVREIQNDARIRSLQDLCRVHGIGPRTAADLLDNKGIHSVAQLREAIKIGEGGGGGSGKLKLRNDQLIGLCYLEDFEKKLSRSTLETIAETIRTALRAKLSLTDCRVEIVGGYRRGKIENGDADILVGPLPGSNTAKSITSEALLRDLVNALYKANLITDFLQTPPGTLDNAKRRSRIKSNHLERSFCVYRIPESGIHARLDLIVAAPDQWAFALLGWTGSQQYERSIRLWAERKCGLLLSSQGLEDKQTSVLVQVTSEEEIFHHLGLPFIEPEFRNC